MFIYDKALLQTLSNKSLPRSVVRLVISQTVLDVIENSICPLGSVYVRLYVYCCIIVYTFNEQMVFVLNLSGTISRQATHSYSTMFCLFKPLNQNTTYSIPLTDISCSKYIVHTRTFSLLEYTFNHCIHSWKPAGRHMYLSIIVSFDDSLKFGWLNGINVGI